MERRGFLKLLGVSLAAPVAMACAKEKEDGPRWPPPCGNAVWLGRWKGFYYPPVTDTILAEREHDLWFSPKGEGECDREVGDVLAIWGPTSRDHSSALASWEWIYWDTALVEARRRAMAKGLVKEPPKPKPGDRGNGWCVDENGRLLASEPYRITSSEWSTTTNWMGTRYWAPGLAAYYARPILTESQIERLVQAQMKAMNERLAAAYVSPVTWKGE